MCASLFMLQKKRMDYAEIEIDQKFHKHIIGKNGVNSKYFFNYRYNKHRWVWTIGGMSKQESCWSYDIRLVAKKWAFEKGHYHYAVNVFKF